MPDNPYVVGDKSAGDQISSSYEGRYLTFLESEFTHPDHIVGEDNLVQKGDPVVLNEKALVGIALKTAKAATDLITIDTEGIFVLEVVCTGALVVGDAIYMTVATAVLTNTVGQWFGWALSAHAEGTGLVSVKVHGSM